MRTTDFAYNTPAHRLVFGWNACATLGDELARLEVKRPMLVVSPRAARSAEVAEIVRALRLSDELVYAGAGLHAPLKSAFEGWQRARDCRADGLIAFGGGSASDLMKGIALALAEDGRLLEFTLERLDDGTVRNPLSKGPKLPSVSIPTTVSGAEITPAFALTEDSGKKILFRDASIAPKLLIYDPALLVPVPARALSESGMNAIAHTIEAFYSRARNPVSHIHAREAVPLLFRGLHAVAEQTAKRDDYLALALGAYYAGVAICNARTGLHHSICHKLGPAMGLTHGLTNSIILPHSLRFNLASATAEFSAMAELIQQAGVGMKTIAPEDAITAIQNLAQRAGLPARLRDVGVDRTKLPAIADIIIKEPGLVFNPRPIEFAGQILQVLEAAW
jgi:alcohol dehydrogenase class IV